MTHQPWLLRQVQKSKLNLPQASTRRSDEPMKEETPNHRNGSHSVEEEDPQEEETEEEVHHRVHQEDHRMEEIQCLLDRTYLPTYNPFPVPKMQKQWENSQTSSTEIEPKPRHSSTN